MMKNSKLLLLLTSFFTFFITTEVFADSGWGSSYGGSGSTFNGSSGVGFGGPIDSFEIFLYIVIGFVNLVFFIGIFIFRKREINKFRQMKNQDNKADVVLNRDYNGSRDLGLDNSPYIGDSDQEIQKYFPDMNERSLIEKLVNIFIDVQEAWMLFDDDSLKKYCSDVLYNSYKSDLDVLKMKNEQNIMNDFKLEACNIKSIREEKGLVVIDLYLHLTFRDYVVDGEGNVIKGDYNKRVHNQYNLEYIISKNASDNICPSCGAKLEAGVDKCNYCNTLINKDYINIVLNRKEELG